MGIHALLVATACCTLLVAVMGVTAQSVDTESASAKLPGNLENNQRSIRATYGDNRRSRFGGIRTDDCHRFVGRSLPKHCIFESRYKDIPSQHRISEPDAPPRTSATTKDVLPQPREDIRVQSSTFWKRDPLRLAPECNPVHGFELPKHCNQLIPDRRAPQPPPVAKREIFSKQRKPYHSTKENIFGRPQSGRTAPITSVNTYQTSGFRYPQKPTIWTNDRYIYQDMSPIIPTINDDSRYRKRSVRDAPGPVPSVDGSRPVLSSSPRTSAPAVAKGDDDIYVPFSGQRLDAFDWQLVRELDLFAGSNAVVSPVGVKMVLGMLHEASSRASAAELRSALGLPAGRSTARDVFRRILQSLQEKQDGFVMRVGNKVFLDESFEPRQNIANIYKLFYSAEIERVDFSSPKVVKPIINEWVSNLTNEQIKNLITNDRQIANLITMVLNVIYFKGDWLYPFSKQSTTKGSFYISPGKTVDVDYMKLTEDLYFSESQVLDAKMLRLPYKGKKYSMFLILPNKKENFKQMIQLVTPALVREQLHSLQKMEVKVKLPKFVFHYTVHLKELLLKLGISRIFTKSDEINLTKNKTNIMISKVIQKVALEVNEEGTEASSATEIDLVNHFGGGQKMFFATHPFLFFVEEEKTGTVVFVGKVMDPSNTPIKPLQPFERKPTMGRANIFKKDFFDNKSV